MEFVELFEYFGLDRIKIIACLFFMFSVKIAIVTLDFMEKSTDIAIKRLDLEEKEKGFQGQKRPGTVIKKGKIRRTLYVLLYAKSTPSDYLIRWR